MKNILKKLIAKVISGIRNATPETIWRTVLFFVAALNQMLVAVGLMPLDLDKSELYQYITTGFTLVTAVVAWWRNNSFTLAAVKADRYMHALKAEGEDGGDGVITFLASEGRADDGSIPVVVVAEGTVDADDVDEAEDEGEEPRG